MSVIDKALTDYFEKQAIPSGAAIGVAVSGGADSLCLALHLAKLAQRAGFRLRAATVDHGLRPESAIEASQVETIMKQRGIPHTTLNWTGRKPKSHLEEKAREKRYELLLNWCHQNGIRYLFLAHHAGDQAETFWSRLARGSGIDGLGGMLPQSTRDGIFLCRPFLNLEKKSLEDDLRRNHLIWAEDSMNFDESYERVRWRHQQTAFNQVGLTPAIIGRSTRRLQRAKTALEFYAHRFQTALVDVMPQGYATISKQAFLTIPEEIQFRVLGKTMALISGNAKPISMEALENWLLHPAKRATIGGCILVESKGVLFVCREPSRMEKAINIPAYTLTHWDRFWILSSEPVMLSIGAKDNTLPHIVRQSIPSVSAAKSVQVSFMIKTQKELEKKFALDYKKKPSEIVYIAFEKGLK